MVVDLKEGSTIDIISYALSKQYTDKQLQKIGLGGTTLTPESIVNTLGYTPADDVKVAALAKEIAGIGGDATVALAEVAKKVKAYQKPDSLTMALMSDTHFTTSNKNADKILTAARLMAKASSVYNVDIVGNLGDIIDGKDTLDAAKDDLLRIVGATASNVANRVAIVRGNHDENGWYSVGGYGGNFTPEDSLDDVGQYQYMDSMNSSDFVRDPARPTGGYGYYDHAASKIRVFLLNTSDIPYILVDGSYKYTTYGYAAFSNEQINFVANALKFEDKEHPNEWAALFMMHIPMDTTNDDGYRFGGLDALIRGHVQMLKVITAYKNGGSYNFSGTVYNQTNAKKEDPEDFMVSVTADYTAKGAGDVICFINGHTHVDNYSNEVGIERSLSRGYAYISVTGSTTFANIIVNRSDSSIAFVRNGSANVNLEPGMVTTTPAVGNIADGEWTVYFDQFRPETVNIFAGWDSDGIGYMYNNNVTPVLDLNTMELTPESKYEAEAYICSKAVPVIPGAKYRVPSAWNGTIIAFRSSGAKTSFPPATVEGNYKTFTCPDTGYYVVFGTNWRTYSDYENMTVEIVL